MVVIIIIVVYLCIASGVAAGCYYLDHMHGLFDECGFLGLFALGFFWPVTLIPVAAYVAISFYIAKKEGK